MQESIWRGTGEEFTYGVPRLSGFIVKELDDTHHFMYPEGWDSAGYCLDCSEASGYANRPKLTIRFGVYEVDTGTAAFHTVKTRLDRSVYYPSLIKRSFSMPQIGLKGEERLGQSTGGGLTWDICLEPVSRFFETEHCLVTVLEAEEEFTVESCRNTVVLNFGGMKVFLALPAESRGRIYANETEMKTDAKFVQARPRKGKGRCLSILHRIRLAPGERGRIVLGLGEQSAEEAEQSAADSGFEASLEAKWNSWFALLPKVSFRNDAEKRAYYKAWSVVRINYFNSPVWGHSYMEALPVYKGVWQWAMSSVEWLSDQDGYRTSEWFRSAMDAFVRAQRADGYLTHAMYIDEKKPGEAWANWGIGTVQLPHFPWVVLRYYYTTLDLDSLKKWFRPLVNYYEYLNNTRDKGLMEIHLWAAFSSFDTGIDTGPVFQRVTYGENGIRERYCYPACLAAARYRYETAMEKIAVLLGQDGERWHREAERTKAALERYLWDPGRNWYGVLHEDGSLDTRIGIDGLFVLVYHMVGRDRARVMRKSFETLIGTYGVHTLAPGEAGYLEDTYWRGAAWPQSCSAGVEAARGYYPDLLEQVVQSVTAMTLANPGVWECCNPRTGQPASSDQGFVCTAAVSSNVGSGGIIGSLLLSHGFELYGIEDTLPVCEMENYHWAGLRITMVRQDAGWCITCRPAEKNGAVLKFAGCSGRTGLLAVKAGQTAYLPDIGKGYGEGA